MYLDPAACVYHPSELRGRDVELAARGMMSSVGPIPSQAVEWRQTTSPPERKKMIR